MSNISTYGQLLTEVPPKIPFIPAWVSFTCTVVLTLVFLICVFGNSIVCAVQMRQVRRSSTDYFVMTMAAFDLFTGLAILPVTVVSLHLPLWLMVASDAICKMLNYCQYSGNIVTTVLLSVIALDRYFKVCRPHSHVLSATTARRMCIVLSAVALIAFLPTTLTVKLDLTYMVCLRTGDLTYIFDSILALAFVGLFGITSVSYILVAKALQKRTRIHNIMVVAPQTRQNILSMNQRVKPVEGNCRETQPNTSTLNQEQKGKLSVIPKMIVDASNTNVRRLQAVHHNQPSPRANQTTSAVGRGPMRIQFAMFLITVVYVVSWILTLLAVGLAEAKSWSESSLILRQTLLKAYLVNCATNPVFYIWLSSEFRGKVKEALKCNTR
ncbi:orexin receptor type 2-like [Mya arenaria]|uniref:orexin receptor type 2-like n=1 Tax=Mya arenaria TaxID=6604 RepID=UPI0022E3E8A0|nr:orexin receptor type 2-like [Mya arenaria]